jgi:chorismate dehydratase
MPETITIGTVPYLNGRPLVFGLDGKDGIRLRAEVPSALGPLLRDGKVDAALLPAIEYFRLAADPGERARTHHAPASAGRGRDAGLVALPVAAIGSRGPVGSVRLFGYTEVAQVRRVLLDPASRTSNALARLIATRRLGIQPHFVLPEKIGPGPARPPDAEVMIGDRALVAERPGAAWVSDLGLEWERFTHRPFVYAFWAARADAPLETIAALLSEARDRGLAAREAIAAEAPSLGVPADIARRYLLEQVRYEFGPKEQDGLRAFYRMAAEDGLAPEGVRLRLYARSESSP